MSYIETLDQRFYPEVKKNWDDTLFRSRILTHLGVTPRLTMLDLGAGAGIVPQMNFRKLAARVVGIDPDPRVINNPYLDEGICGLGDSIPAPNESFDLVTADNVLEHLEDPTSVFREINRVLKPGGIFLAKTPNLTHYMPTISRLTPVGFHRWYNRLRGRNATDTFPTHYRANSRAKIQALARDSNFTVSRVELIEGRPEYLRFSALSYLSGIAYERLVNSVSMLAPFRILLIIELRKPTAV